jgi:hypothetical protein
LVTGSKPADLAKKHGFKRISGVDRGSVNLDPEQDISSVEASWFIQQEQEIQAMYVQKILK